MSSSLLVASCPRLLTLCALADREVLVSDLVAHIEEYGCRPMLERSRLGCAQAVPGRPPDGGIRGVWS